MATMTPTKPHTNQIFVNLPVSDLQRSKEFFRRIGFEFNPKFEDENGASMIISENIYAMLLQRDFFKTFTRNEIADSTRETEVINSLSTGSREEVDEFMARALEAGAIEPREPTDMGFMYDRAFQDLDGHMWEIFYMDESAMPQEAPEAASAEPQAAEDIETPAQLDEPVEPMEPEEPIKAEEYPEMPGEPELRDYEEHPAPAPPRLPADDPRHGIH